MFSVKQTSLCLFLLCVTSSLPKPTTSASISDIEHIVVFMQENRAFDHYFGKMRGVRGFNDRSAPPLPDGRKQFHQPLGNATKIQECRGYGCSNEQQGGHCLPGMPGSKNKTYTCCYLKWVKGNSCSTPFPPPATSCEGATTLQECQIQNQTCTKGTKGAGPMVTVVVVDGGTTTWKLCAPLHLHLQNICCHTMLICLRLVGSVWLLQRWIIVLI